MGGVIDLNTVNDDEDDAAGLQGASLSSSFASECSSSASSSVCLELWHACAGPLISLPKKGSVVVYLPQGHLEQISDFPAMGYDLPSHVFCRVVDVKLHAVVATDEVYARLSLVPESEIEQKLQEGGNEADWEEEEIEGVSKSTTPHMFCKTLTASDTSSHGGFSVPRRAAEDCFPPLDHKQQRPSQELVAKDLHDVEWKFRHIYRGQPRRHLLTTGWSAFVNRKKLVSGDAVLFLRGGNGDLRLGIRRANQVRGGTSFSVLGTQSANLATFIAVANAVSTKSVFHIGYNPRGSPSEFIIPFRKFSKSLNHTFSIGVRFKMRFETEDAAERRYTGLITGISDMDPVRWPGSKWRCLLLRWDDVDTNLHNRVSPWEIEPSDSVSGSSSLLAPGSKRTRNNLPSGKPDFPVPNGIGFSDFGESLRFQKVLQGQEILGFNNPYDGIDAQNHHPSEMRRCIPGLNGSEMSAMGSGTRILLGNSDVPVQSIDFGESVRFHRVLQGQEITSKPQYGTAPVDNQANQNGGFRIFDGIHKPRPASGWSMLMQGCNNHVQSSTACMQVSSPSSVLMFQQPSTQVSSPCSAYGVNNQEKGEEGNNSLFDGSETFGGKRTTPSPCGYQYATEELRSSYRLNPLNEPNPQGTEHPTALLAQITLRGSQYLPPTGKSGCKLFGFPLTKESQIASEGNASTPITSYSTETLNLKASFAAPSADMPSYWKRPMLTKTVGRSCTKVHKQGSVVGRAIDLTKLDGYDDLICELERLFNMEGLLNDPEKGWQVVYTDDEDDMMLIGDDPWKEFCNSVSKILIYAHNEVVSVVPVVADDDGHSCSKEST